jgi:hypothetical protein
MVLTGPPDTLYRKRKKEKIMTRHRRLLREFCLVLVVCLSVAAPAGQAQDPPTGGKTAEKAFKYNPPSRNAPAGRVGGSTRGLPGSDLVVEVLSPSDHVGLSANDQPVLYWYLSRPVDKPLEVTLDTAELSSAAPLVETTLKKTWPAGISAVSLRDLGVRLKPDVIYRWSVAVVLDSAQRSTDVTASGLIRHVRSAPGPASADPESIARILAEKGYWYDALTALSLDIDRQPARRKQRADLLEQVGLTAPAAYDRAALGKTPSH